MNGYGVFSCYAEKYVYKGNFEDNLPNGFGLLSFEGDSFDI